MIKNTILLGLTTTPGSDWKEKIKETKKLDLKEIALFPTCLKLDERKEMYDLLKGTPIRSIPHVHIREEDFEPWELQYLIDNYETIFFNIHDEADMTILDRFSDFKQYLYLENGGKLLSNFTDTLDKIEGLCVDFAHLNNAKKTNHSHFYKMADLIKKYPIGCCHISAEVGETNNGGHFFHNLSEFDYLKNYLNLIPNIISIELENSLAEQLKVRKYLQDMISKEQFI